MLLSEELTSFIQQIQPKNHILLFYDTKKSKREILYSYLSDGLAKGKGIIYICSDEGPEEVRRGMQAFGIDVEPNERAGNIIIKNFNEWYIVNGKAESLRIISRWNEAFRRFSERGLGLRATGEVSCFFREDKVRELLRYEYALQKVLPFAFDAICAYDVNTIVRTGYTDMIMPLVRAHGKAIFASKSGSMILEPEDVEDTDIEKLLEIEI